MSLKTKLNQKRVEESSNLYKSYLQSYLAWLDIQNPSFYINLKTEELVNYFLKEIQLPKQIETYIHSNPFEILAKTYEYISRYQDKTSMFVVQKQIKPKKRGNYREV